MDSQTPPRLAHSASGNALHVCHNCGWTFPNSHPSAKQRRSHRKVCGTIEGHKKLGVVDLDGSSHSNVSDDERERRLSDDKDCKNPSSEISEVSGAENGSTRKKSEDDLYSDAALEFSVAKGGAINEENHSTNGPETEGIKPQGSTIKSLNTCKSEYFQSEESAFLLNGEPTKSETQKDTSCVIDGDFDGSSKLALQDTKAAGESPDADVGIVNLTIPKSHENVDELVEKNEDVLVVSVADDLLGNNDTEVMLEDFKDHRAHMNQSVASGFVLAKEIDEGDEAVIGIPASGSCALVEEESDIEAPKRSDDLKMPDVVNYLTVKEFDDISSSTLRENCSDIESHLAGEDDHGKAVKSDLCEAVSAMEDYETEVPATDSEKGDSEKANAIGSACGDDDVSDDLKNGQAVKMFPVNSPESGDKEAVLEYEKAEAEKHGLAGVVKDEIRVESEIQSSTKEGLSKPANDVSEPSGDHATETQKDLPLEQIVASLSAVHLIKESHTVAEDAVPGSIDMVLEVKEGALDNKPVQSPTATTDEKNGPTRELANLASGVSSGSFPGKSDRQQTGGSVLDISVHSGSPTDSLENNWGSVSALSAQSEISKKSRPANEPPQSSSEKPEEIEAPSFMTLVEPTNGQSAEQAGWFPSKAHGPNESQGRKKNEEIIAKVTNWGDHHNQQQRTPLKSLLGEPSQPNKNSQSKSMTVNSILAHKESEIKREKRKSNPFMCCIRI